MTKILVVDDEEHIRQLVTMYLTKEGFQVETAADGRAALQRIHAVKPDLVVLDLMLPETDGWSVCKELRRSPLTESLPIIMLTARDDLIDRVLGLELGADDYLTKPFNPRELVARVRAVLRRTTRAATGGKALQAGDIQVDLERREARAGGQLLQLRAKEFDLLAAFVERPGTVFTRDALLNRVWGYEHEIDTRTVDVHVSALRERLQGAQSSIETVWGVGYKFVDRGGADAATTPAPGQAAKS
ncbi:MAG TPA: response regulator transcription factor [Thermomicrobiales bacterium]|jgi:DNA-binding response OmpR family regulator|nr:response regulator transcription factor [Thermomicrobiales bacterium]